MGVFSVVSTFFNPALMAIMPAVVPGEQRLIAANSLFSSTQAVTRIAGPVLGGLVVAWQGPAVAFWVDASSFAVSALFMMAFVRVRARPPRPATSTGFFSEAMAGVRELLRDRLLWVVSC